MGIALDITHIGEALIADLLKNNKEVQNNFKKLFFAVEVKEACANKPIDNKSDSMHRIDVLVNKYIAIEIKLGTTITTPGKYCKSYLSKGDNNNKGNMLNKLASGRLTVDNQEVQEEWILLVRNDQIKEKLTRKKCRLGEKNEELWKEIIKHCTIISLEELISGISPDDFNEAVSRCIKSNNYSAEWGINLSAPSGVSGLSSQEK